MSNTDTIRERAIKLSAELERATWRTLEASEDGYCLENMPEEIQEKIRVRRKEEEAAWLPIIEDALSPIDPDAGTGWMIEKHNPIPMWWNGCPKREGNGAWSSEPNDGIRFSRKLDAELCAIAQGFSLSKVLITDHRWG